MDGPLYKFVTAIIQANPPYSCPKQPNIDNV